MVTKVKLDKIKKTAQLYIFENNLGEDWRVDVVAIEGKKYEIIKNVTL